MKQAKETLKKALLEGGEVMKRAFYKPKTVRYKGIANLVTKTDKLAEERIIRIIKKNFPDHAILAEESQEAKGRAPYKWIIDPIDGTTNFAHGLPLAAVSIGFEDHGEITMGGVYNPLMNELFWAEKKKGAFLNGKRIHVSNTRKLKASLLVTGFPYDKSLGIKYYMNIAGAFLRKSHGFRRLGSASLDLCYLACGRFDGYWEKNLMAWDQAAGYLIAKEAGGACTNFRGEPFDVYQKEKTCSKRRLEDQSEDTRETFSQSL